MHTAQNISGYAPFIMYIDRFANPLLLCLQQRTVLSRNLNVNQHNGGKRPSEHELCRVKMLTTQNSVSILLHNQVTVRGKIIRVSCIESQCMTYA